MSVRAVNFWEHLGVLRYIQAKHRVWLTPNDINASWHHTDIELWRDFPDDYLRVRTLQKLHRTTKIDFVEPTHNNQEDTSL